MKTSDQLNELAAALAKAQGEIQNVVKDAKNPHYKSDYATLDAITDTVRPIFSKHGLSVVQMPAFADGVVTVETILLHTSGQWIGGLPAAPLAKADAQGVGSATTYLRRYSLAGLAAIAQTDDDGNAASQAPKQTEVMRRPAGYDDWWTDMLATADEGVAALRDAWRASKEEYRAFTDRQNKPAWEAIKAKAEKVKVHANA
jgi:hypothetical protein